MFQLPCEGWRPAVKSGLVLYLQPTKRIVHCGHRREESDFQDGLHVHGLSIRPGAGPAPRLYDGAGWNGQRLPKPHSAEDKPAPVAAVSQAPSLVTHSRPPDHQRA